MKILTVLLSATLLLSLFSVSSHAENEVALSKPEMLKLQQKEFLNAYIKAWDETDEKQRLAIIKTFWSNDPGFKNQVHHFIL